MEDERQITIVLGVLMDTHIVGSKLLQWALEDKGFKVVYIGGLALQEEFIKATLETDAKAIFISSSGGHGMLDCQGLLDKCIEAGLKDVLIYAGGNVVTFQQDRDWKDVEREFEKMGINRVYRPGVEPTQVIDDLKSDLARLGIEK